MRFVGLCCREWILAFGGKGRCGLCGEIPQYLRPYDPDADGVAVRAALARLDGSDATAVSVMTGLEHGELADLGGVP